MDDERIEEVNDSWDELLESIEDFTWGEGNFDLDLYRETMYKTWKLFSERIDFAAPEEDYALPICLAEVFAQVRLYADKRQIEMRRDGGTIALSAMIAFDLYYSIRYRAIFNRDEPVVSAKHMIDGELLRLTYHLDTGELHVTDGFEPEDTPAVVFHPKDGSVSEIKQEKREPIIVTDISRWWDEDEEEE